MSLVQDAIAGLEALGASDREQARRLLGMWSRVQRLSRRQFVMILNHFPQEGHHLR